MPESKKLASRLDEATWKRHPLILYAKHALAALSLLFLVYRYYSLEKVATDDGGWVKVPGEAQTRARLVSCAEAKDRVTTPYCSPATCGRFILDKFLTSHEAYALKSLATAAFIITGGGAGPASIADYQSGAVSKDKVFVDLYKFIVMQKDKGHTPPHIDESALEVYQVQ